jgi:single-strand DNA-binding protein
MASLNKVMLIGRLTDNPEPPRTLPNSGSTVVKFRFAVGRSRKNPQTGQWENDPNPLFIDCEAFSRPDSRRNLPDLISRYCQKGSQLYLEGRLQLDQWEDKNGGGKRSKHKIVVENFEFLDKGPGGGGGSDFGGAHDEMDGPPARQGVARGGAPARSPAAHDDPAGGSGEDIPF